MTNNSTTSVGRSLRILAIAAALLLACIALASGEDPRASKPTEKELQIRAAFLLNVIRFATWPADAFDGTDAPIILAIVGDDPFGHILEQTFSQIRVHERVVEIRRVEVSGRDRKRPADEREDLITRARARIRPAHVVYFAECDQDALTELFLDLNTHYMLTVGHRRECAETHTALSLGLEDDRVVVFANFEHVEALDVRVSSRLLALARRITTSPPDRGFHP